MVTDFRAVRASPFAYQIGSWSFRPIVRMRKNSNRGFAEVRDMPLARCCCSEHEAMRAAENSIEGIGAALSKSWDEWRRLH